MSRQYWAEAIAATTVSGTAVASTTTETSLFPNILFPANYMQDGRTMRFTACGSYSTTATPTLLFTSRWGPAVTGVVLCKSAAITGASSVTAALWWLEVIMSVRSNGTTGTIMANGVVILGSGTAPTVGSATGAPGISPMTNGGITTPGVATCDFTADTVISLTLTWSASSASNTATGTNYMMESMN